MSKVSKKKPPRVTSKKKALAVLKKGLFSFVVSKKLQVFLGYYVLIVSIVFSCFVIYGFVGPKYEYISAGDDSLKVYRYNKFDGNFSRCFINLHRGKNDHLKKFDKSSNSETLSCYKSYEFTKNEIDAADFLKAIEDIDKK